MSVSKYKDDEFLDKYENTIDDRVRVCFRKISTLIKPIQDKKILDLGCGPGDFSQELFSKGADVIAIDKSKKWIDLCKIKHKESKSLKFITASGSNLSFIKTKSIDVVIMNLVLPNVESPNDVKKIFSEVSRVLKKDGIFVFSDLHPMLKMSSKVYPDRYQKYSKGFSYFKDGSSFICGIEIDRNKKNNLEFNNKHWTLETYTKFLNELNMYIYNISEPTYKKTDPVSLLKYKIPEYIILACKKK